MSAKFVEIDENVYINTDLIVKAWISEADHQLKDTEEWVHNMFVKQILHTSKSIICFKMIDGSVETSAGIEEAGSSLYANAWEAINSGLKFDFPN
jgi:hypothetical protein